MNTIDRQKEVKINIKIYTRAFITQKHIQIIDMLMNMFNFLLSGIGLQGM